MKQKKEKLPKIVFEYRKIMRKKELIVSKKDVQSIMNALESYRNKRFRQEYKVYLEELRTKFLMLIDW